MTENNIKDLDAEIMRLTGEIHYRPDDGGLYAARARIFLQKDDEYTALCDFVTAKLYGDSGEYALECAKLYFKRRDYRSALKECELAIGTEGFANAAYCLKIKILMEQSRYEEAETTCYVAGLLFDGDENFIVKKIECMKKTGRSKEAFKELKTYLVSGKIINNGEVYLLAAELSLEEGKYAEALEYSSEALKKLVDYQRCMKIKAKALIALARYSEALESLNILTSAADGDAMSYFLRGICNVRLEQFEDAIYNFSRAIELDNSVSGGYAERASVYEKTGKQQLAVDDYTRAIALDLENAGLHIRRGKLLMKQRRLKSALKDFRYVGMIFPENCTAHFFSGVIYEKLGENKRALAEYRVAQKLQPETRAIVDAVQRMLLVLER